MADRSAEHEELPMPTAAAVAARLERVRAGVHRWIDRIEEQLADASRWPAPGREDGLARGFAELEERRDALRAEVERREREWEARLEALEHDRRLLAEAWERLEGEQLAAVPLARDPATADRAATSPMLAPPAGGGESAVDLSILRQFEALRQDVRRRAGAH